MLGALGFARPPPSSPGPLSRQRARGGRACFARDRARGLKCLVRLSLRGHHPHPPAPSPASGRGGDSLVLRAIVQGGLSVWCACVCAVTTLIPRPLLPPAGEGEARLWGAPARPLLPDRWTAVSNPIPPDTGKGATRFDRGCNTFLPVVVMKRKNPPGVLEGFDVFGLALLDKQNAITSACGDA